VSKNSIITTDLGAVGYLSFTEDPHLTFGRVLTRNPGITIDKGIARNTGNVEDSGITKNPGIARNIGIVENSGIVKDSGIARDLGITIDPSFGSNIDRIGNKCGIGNPTTPIRMPMGTDGAVAILEVLEVKERGRHGHLSGSLTCSCSR
jgi:hypothetical protein